MTPLHSDAEAASGDRPPEIARRAATLVEKLPALLDADVGQTPYQSVYSENKLELRRYGAADRPGGKNPPILLVYALINRPYVLDISPDRSVVQSLCAGGSDVYLVDWGEPSPLDHSLSLADYVTRYLDQCVDAVREQTGAEQIDLLGYCMGGTMATMYAALEPAKVRRLGQLAAPLATDGSDGLLGVWSDEALDDPWVFHERRGNVPATYLDTGFRLTDPVQNYVTTYLRLLENVEDDEFVERFGRVEKWLRDGVDVPGTAFAEFVEAVYRRNALAANELVLDGRPVDLANVTMPVLQVVGERDRLVPPPATRRFESHVPADVTEMAHAAGHVGLAVSESAHDTLWPRVREWFSG